ncbi:MAG: septum formation initiator family protein [bacterium]|nr:septum formation initiator family protein [bacterium]
MRLAIIIVLTLIIGLISYQHIRFFYEWRDVEAEHATLQNQLQTIKKENENIAEDLNYFQNPENLEKEVRAQLNYKKQGEKVIIVVPKQ